MSAAGRLRSEVIDPSALSTDARAALVDELHLVQCEIFDGVGREEFRKYVVESSATANWLQVFRGDGDRAVGYFALHRFDRELDGRPCSIFRAEAGTLRAWRGRAPDCSSCTAQPSCRSPPRTCSSPLRPSRGPAPRRSGEAERGGDG